MSVQTVASAPTQSGHGALPMPSRVRMTPAEENLYWWGWGKVAHRLFGIKNGGFLLAALVRANGDAVLDSRFPAGNLRDGAWHYATPGSVRVLVCRVRSALSDMGMDTALERVRGDHGEPGTGAYRLLPEACAELRRMVEAAA